MTTLILGANGATGKLLTEQLLNARQKVKVMVRPQSNIPEGWRSNSLITIIEANVTEISVNEMTKYLSDCSAVAYCLGHNLTLRGMFGKPRKLVTDAVRVVCQAIGKNPQEKPVKLALMNTAGNSNRDIAEQLSAGEKVVIGLLRLLLPPHSDNEGAADFLRVNIGQNNPVIEWVAVRPDSLTNENHVTDYTLHASPTKSALFNPGKTSRINVGNFMARLITEDDLWNKWKGQMPVIYNETEETEPNVA